MRNRDIEQQILQQARQSDKVRQHMRAELERIVGYWRSVSPVDKGSYAASVKVFRRPISVNGMPGAVIGATDFKAHWVEYGTGEPGPTKAAAPRAKTAAHFFGDEKKVSEVLDDEDLSFGDRKTALESFRFAQ